MPASPLLPAWLTEFLPEVTEPHVVSLGPDKTLILTAPDGTITPYPGPAEVSDATRGLDLAIEREVYEAYGEDPDMTLGIFFPTGRNLSGMLMAFSDKDRLHLLESAYSAALEATIRYEADPTSFYAAYDFIDSHPAFWTCEDGGWFWRTSGHCARVDQMVMRVDREEDNAEAYPQGYVIALETGAHVGPDEHTGVEHAYTAHYHDYRLDVYALTFEEAYVKLAALVHKFFNPDGTERPDVAHDKPEWVEELERRVQDFEEDRVLDGIEAATLEAEGKSDQ